MLLWCCYSLLRVLCAFCWLCVVLDAICMIFCAQKLKLNFSTMWKDVECKNFHMIAYHLEEWIVHMYIERFGLFHIAITLTMLVFIRNDVCMCASIQWERNGKIWSLYWFMLRASVSLHKEKYRLNAVRKEENTIKI